MSKELIELISNNPELPVFAWVNGEICGDDCGYWLGQFSSASIREYAELDFNYGYHETNWVFKDEPEDLIDYLVETVDYMDYSSEEAEEKAIDYINNLEYKRAIFVFVDSL